MLTLRDVRVQFGGTVAIDGLSLKASIGEITGLIGPNGAGKTTAFNVCSGLVRPVGGTVEFDGVTLDRKGPSERARLGIGRTFQHVQLSEASSVRENVALGVESAFAGNSWSRQLFPRRGERAEIRRRVDEALEICDLAPLAAALVGPLSTGQKRLVELARCVAIQPKMLLLDEPSSGLDGAETARFEAMVSRVVSIRGCGILLVEHDMSLVMSICRNIYVLNFGQLIFEGAPAAVQNSPVVQESYLGFDFEAESSTGTDHE